jgi:exonuclease III
VATYNINSMRGSLAAVLAQAKLARIDILLLQELHFYDNGEHLSIGPLADRLGWTLVHSPTTRLGCSTGCRVSQGQSPQSLCRYLCRYCAGTALVLF